MSATFSLENVGVRRLTPDGQSRWVLKNFSIRFQSTEHIGLLGRNGSGKTTIIRVIGGLDRISKGIFKISPQKVRTMVQLQRPEEHFIRSSVGELIHSYASHSLSADDIYEIINQVGLRNDLAKRPPLSLSTGEQRLVAIACALAFKPSFMVLDEPMAGLDARGRRQIKDALINIKKIRNVGWIIVSHHPDDLFGIVDRLWILENGKLAKDGQFSRPSLDALTKCLAVQDPSLYYQLARISNRGIVVPDKIFKSSIDEIAEFLRESKKL